MKRLKLSVIGAGKIFENFHLKAINTTNLYNIVGVVDKNEKRLNEIKNNYNLPIFHSIDEIEEADLCFVATPPNIRKAVISPAISKGMNIVCEKPFTYTSEEAKFLIAEADKKGKRIFVTQTRRLFPNILILKKMIENGSISNIKKINMIEGGLYGWESVGTERAEIFEKDFGVLNDVGAHLVDAITFLFNVQNVEIEKSVFDYDLGANNVNVVLKVNVDGNNGFPIILKISRDQNLFNYIQIETDKSVIKTRSLLSEFVKIYDKNNFELFVGSEDYPKTMEDVFEMIWRQVYDEINNNNTMGFSLNAKTVIKGIEMIEEIAEKRRITEFDDYYNNEVWNGDN